MVKVGIDAIAVYTARYALQLATLAAQRDVALDKFHVGLGQFIMSVPSPDEDIVTMAASAAHQALRDINKDEIAMLLFATESGIDQSKAAGLFVHGLLNLPAQCRVLEVKQACYGGTAGLQLALPFLRENPNKKVLLIASDIARYGLKTTGESSQGCGACAIVLSVNPRILAIEPEYGVFTENVMDFWRPNYMHEAIVDGKYSSKLYLTSLEKCWHHYQAESSRHFDDHDYFCYHTPVPRLVEKAHQHLLKVTQQTHLAADVTEKQIQPALKYGREVGNSYTASLYIGLAGLLDLAEENLAGKRIGFYSYGSGCVAEFFSGVVQPHYQSALHTDYHTHLLSSREMLSYEQYESFYSFAHAQDGQMQEIPVHRTGPFRLAKIDQHKRIYESLAEVQASPVILPASQEIKAAYVMPAKASAKAQEKEDYLTRNDREREIITVSAPGKLILSGEHSVVYGGPALAMAIDRYATATVTREVVPQILFDLADIAHHSRLSFSALSHLKDKIKHKYRRFVRGDFSIRHVLQKPFELAQFAMGVFTDSLNLSLPHGVKIRVQSDIPIGCGMGSSAATILSVMQATAQYLQIPLPAETLYSIALEAENMQHGQSSGLDLRVALLGGCLFIEGDELQKRVVPEWSFYLVNTGAPVTTTGQCVEKVASHFKSSSLQEEFAAVTRAMDNALIQQAPGNLHQAIKHNHRLLTQIGVVPEKVQQFIAKVESLNGAAKICGAGAVSGAQAGAVLVSAEDKTIITNLCTDFGYNVIPISGTTRGVHAA